MIDTKALRSRILDLAIQGKLTEQLPSDGTAEELYQQIQAEKQALIKEGKIKKEKLLPEISADEIPFEIPKNWKLVRIIEIGVTVTGCTPSKKQTDNYGGKYPFFKPADLDNGIHITKASEYLSELGKTASRQLKKGTILVCCIGSLGKCAIIGIDGTCNQQINAFTPYICSSEYLYFAISNSFFTSQLNQVSRATTLEIVNKSKFDNCIIPLPPLAEQKRIVERVEEIFRLLDTIDEAQEKYSADSQILKAKLITAGIQGKLTKQLESDGTAEELYHQIQAEKSEILKQRQGRKDNSIKPVQDDVPYEIPVNWKWIRFGETGFFRKGPFGSSLTKSMFVPKSDDSIKVYEQQHAIKKDHTLGTYYITKEYFDESMKGFEVLPDDIIISCAGTIGETFIMPDNIEKGIINQALMRVTVVPSIDKQFFLYYFNSQLKESAKEGNGSAITNIPPFDVLKNLYFPLPPLAEQKRIADVLERVLGVFE